VGVVRPGHHLRGRAVEAKTGGYAFALAGPEQTLMISPQLDTTLRKHEMSGLLQSAFPLMFTTPTTKAKLTERWPEAVALFSGRKNTPDVLKQKAGLITSYILNHYDIPLDALSLIRDNGSDPLIDQHADNQLRQDLAESVERELKLEAAASWYRLFDELAFCHIRRERELFSDYLVDSLAEMLALQGAGTDEIVDRLHQRGTEYASLESLTGQPGKDLFWKMGKHALSLLGAEKNALRIVTHSRLLVGALKRVMVREILTGRETSPDTLSGTQSRE
jgi:hypothetical protein